MMAAAKFMPSGRNTVIVRVTSYQDKCLKGMLSGLGKEQPAQFSSLAQFLFLLEDWMDRENLPQRGEEPRAFRQRALPAHAAPLPENETALATFQISVLFRQNASWQGTLIWTDQDLDAQFRSVLDLIRLLDSALTGETE